MELVLVVPIFLLLLFAIVEFSLLSSAQTRIENAARHGARLLCLSDQDHDDVRDAVRKMLGQLSVHAAIEIEDGGRPGDIVQVRIRVPMRNATPDLLWMTGFSVRDRYLAGAVPMAREHDTAASRIDRL